MKKGASLHPPQQSELMWRNWNGTLMSMRSDFMKYQITPYMERVNRLEELHAPEVVLLNEYKILGRLVHGLSTLFDLFEHLYRNFKVMTFFINYKRNHYKLLWQRLRTMYRYFNLDQELIGFGLTYNNPVYCTQDMLHVIFNNWFKIYLRLDRDNKENPVKDKNSFRCYLDVSFFSQGSGYIFWYYKQIRELIESHGLSIAMKMAREDYDERMSKERERSK